MDTLKFEILEDGTVTVKTSEISDGNHMSADALMAEFEALMGGSSVIIPNEDELKKAHARAHAHGRAHAHNH